nr:MAG TPA: hypothetical protein [Caudoviricetes sp.]
MSVAIPWENLIRYSFYIIVNKNLHFIMETIKEEIK